MQTLWRTVDGIWAALVVWAFGPRGGNQFVLLEQIGATCGLLNMTGMYIYVYIYICVCVCACVYVFVRQSVRPPAGLPACLPACLPVSASSIHVCTGMSMYDFPSICLSASWIDDGFIYVCIYVVESCA